MKYNGLTSSANSKSPSNFRLHLASVTRTSSTVATNIQENRMVLVSAGEHRPPWTDEMRCRVNSGKHVHRPDSKTTNKRSSRMITAKRWKGAHVNFDTFVFPFSTKRKRSVRRSNELWLREPSRGDAALPQTRSRLLVGFRRMKGRDGGDAGGYLYKPDYPSLSVSFPWATCISTTLR